jgi:hypothetical protein
LIITRKCLLEVKKENVKCSKRRCEKRTNIGNKPQGVDELQAKPSTLKQANICYVNCKFAGCDLILLSRVKFLTTVIE